MPGDTVNITKGDIVLYAQWDGITIEQNQSSEISIQLQQSGFAVSINWLKNLFKL